jgi:hypothetical protein
MAWLAPRSSPLSTTLRFAAVATIYRRFSPAAARAADRIDSAINQERLPQYLPSGPVAIFQGGVPHFSARSR